MPTTSYTVARKNLKAIFDKACNDSEPMVVKRRNGEDVVILSLSDYESLDETAYLLSSPANRKHLKKGLGNYKKNEFVEIDSKTL